MNDTIGMNAKSFETLFREHHEGLGRYALSIVKDLSLAEEVVQKLFVNLWEKRKELKIQSNEKAYLYRSVHNYSLNELKKMKRNQLHIDISESDNVSGSDYTDSPIEQKELSVKIDSAIETLPQKCGEVFRLSRFEELSYKEISEKLDISIKTVENHMGKALKLMRVEMREYLSEVLVFILLLQIW